jgi:poly(hydroxyalkanoate) granule-associated protein
MVTKIHKSAAGTDDGKSTAHLASTVRESASQIWLAGLGAFAKAQEEGGKVFDTLVKEGMAIQRKTQTAAEERFSEATSRMASMASGISSRATGQWDKLESIFEERVARALNRLGVPSSKDIDALVARIDELNRSVARLNARATPVKAAKAAKAAGGSNAATKPSARKRAPRKAV